jgi:hypothetical protein
MPFIVGGTSSWADRLKSFILLTIIDLLLGEFSQSAAFHRFCALAS